MIICAGEDFCSFSHRNFPHYPSWGGKLEKKASRDFEQILACELYASRPQPSTLKKLVKQSRGLYQIGGMPLFCVHITARISEFCIHIFPQLMPLLICLHCLCHDFLGELFLFLCEPLVAYVHDA